jgi:hypothetical protein
LATHLFGNTVQSANYSNRTPRRNEWGNTVALTAARLLVNEIDKYQGIRTKPNETKQKETKQNETKRSEPQETQNFLKRNETENKFQVHETKRNETILL